MVRAHHISFMALLTGDTMVMKRLYPEWGLEVRLPYFAHGTLLCGTAPATDCFPRSCKGADTYLN